MSKEKKLHHIAARYIIGEDIKASITGKDLELESLQSLLEVSRSLKIALDESSDFETIAKLIEQKRAATRKFEDLSGITWRL
jgi:hypothetical protein